MKVLCIIFILLIILIKSKIKVNNISKNNTCVYFSSLNNEISKKRRHNLISQLNKYNIKYEIDPGVTNLPKLEIMYQHILNKLNRFKKSKYQFAIICDDDFFPCDNFWNKLLTSSKSFSKNFRTFHLCPGCLWGRKFRDSKKYGKLNNEVNLSNLKHNKFTFYDINKNNWNNKKMWLGGPIAFLINKKYIDSFIKDYQNYWEKNKVPNDCILTNILSKKDFVAREPQLCYENEEGGSLF